MTFYGTYDDIIDARTFVAELVHRPATPFSDRAVCRGHDPALWFPPNGVNVDRARAICSTCPVVGECLSFAIADESLTGVWGGTTARERRQLRRHAA